MPIADKKIRELYYSMEKNKHETTQDLIDNLHSLKGKTKSNFYQIDSKYYDEMNYRRQNWYFRFKEVVLSENAEIFSKIFHEVSS